MMTGSAIVVLLAAIPAYFYFRNVGVFRTLPSTDYGTEEAMSVLIPARDESGNIGACVEAVLGSASADTEVVVLDDHSEDDTAEIVMAIARRDCRVRLIAGAALPAGWNGKQHACWQLAQAAQRETLVFLDADVRLEPNALPRIAAALRIGNAHLMSGFPRQVTQSLLEKLLIPLIHFVLLGFLSLRHMRRIQKPAFAAGCGQLFVTTREAYQRSGGHAAIRASRHDGIKLPRLYLAQGLKIDVFDATDLAHVRMYHGARATWQGLAKNADEGVASPGLIGPVTALLLGGQVLPYGLLAASLVADLPILFSWLGCTAVALAILPRLDACRRFQQPWINLLLHPVGVLLFLAIQWTALLRSLTGNQVTWKGRPAATGT